MRKSEEMSRENRRAGWIGSILLFGAIALSLAALFQGSPWLLAAAALLLAGGLYWIRRFMSGQSLS